jgi:hypothetical protein
MKSSIRLHFVNFYKFDEIEGARSLLAQVTNKRLPKHTGSDVEKRKRTLTDIVKLCLDPDVKMPTFYAVDLARLPPVGVQHADISAILQEVASLRMEVRAAVSIKEELELLRSQVASLVTNTSISSFDATSNEVQTVRNADGIVKDALQSGALQAVNKRQVTRSQPASQKTQNRKPVVGKSSSNSLVKGVETLRVIDIFVSRLHPSTTKSELVDCVDTMKGDLSVKNIECIKLTSKYEHLYSSYHVAVTVNTECFWKGIELFTSADVWPMGVFVRRYFKPKVSDDGSNK